MRCSLVLPCCVLICLFFYAEKSCANTSEHNGLTSAERVSLARSFVAKIKSGFNRYDRAVSKAQKNILPDGEYLFLQPVMGKNFRPNALISARSENQRLLLSFKDFVDSLSLAIRFSGDNKNADGWYIREDFEFSLDGDSGEAVSSEGRFTLSEFVLFEESDIWVPSEELAEWFGIHLDIGVSSQELKIKSELNLPIYAKYLRENAKIRDRKRVGAASLPLGGEEYGYVGVPVIDVSTASSFNARKNSENTSNHSANIRTSGDFALGTLKTRSIINNRDQLALVRATYSQDSVDGQLLGPLQAKRIEIGDVATTRVPYGSNVEQELGVRVTNTDAVRGFSRATTAISGSAIPGWDVELYRENQLIALQVVGEDGFYEFSNIDLFQNDTTFRLIFYGLQGEVREETVFVPFDRDLLGQGRGIYDFSVTLDEKNTYSSSRFNNKDVKNEGALNVNALYEQPIIDGLTSTLGFQSAEDSLGERRAIGSAGLSTTVQEMLINVSGAVNEEGGLASALTARRDFGEHQVATGFNWSSSDFSQQVSNFNNSFAGVSGGLATTDSDNYSATARILGPIPLGQSFRARYGADARYSFNSDGDDLLAMSGSVNAGYKRVSFSAGMRHEENSSSDLDKTNAFGSVAGAIGRNRLRVNATYDINPSKELRTISASYNRRFSNTLETALDVTRLPETELTTYQARLDWQAGFIRLSPSVRYDSDENFFAGLNTRFGIVRDPASQEFQFLDRDITNFGLVSAFVYLDKNGDGEFNNDDEPLEDITVIAPQSSRQVKTNAKGVALFNNVTRLRLTDVFVEKDSLQDPAWIPGFEGVSILPREGYVAQIDFPIHMSGEVDGGLYAKVVPLPDQEGKSNKSSPIPMRNVTLQLYNDKGEVEQSVVTDSTGFYYFTQIPPGRYLLLIEEESAQRKNIIRPLPLPIEIGYDGTVIYGKDIYVETGTDDVPAEIRGDLEEFKEQHPHVNFDPEMHDVVLNLGEYNSRLLMSVVWYKLKSRYSAALGQGELFVPPAQSYADVKTGKHALRVGLGDASLDEAYDRCRDLMAQDQYCKVEIYPAAMKKASVE